MTSLENVTAYVQMPLEYENFDANLAATPIEVDGRADGTRVRPQREDLAIAMGEILSRGFTLKAQDVTYMLPYYGYEPRSNATSIVTFGFKSLMRKLGYDIRPRKFKNRKIFVDPRLPLEETDIAATEAEIIKGFRITAEEQKLARHK